MFLVLYCLKVFESIFYFLKTLTFLVATFLALNPLLFNSQITTKTAAEPTLVGIYRYSFNTIPKLYLIFLCKQKNARTGPTSTGWVSSLRSSQLLMLGISGDCSRESRRQLDQYSPCVPHWKCQLGDNKRQDQTDGELGGALQWGLWLHELCFIFVPCQD